MLAALTAITHVGTTVRVLKLFNKSVLINAKNNGGGGGGY